MSRPIPVMDEIIDNSLDELKETVNALRITYAPSIAKTHLQTPVLKDVKDDQFERGREVFADNKRCYKT